MKLRIFISTVVLVAICGFFFIMNSQKNDPYEVIALINRNTNQATGEILDYAGDIGWTGPDCVGYDTLDNGKIRIYFGDLQFDIGQDEVDSEEFMQLFKHLGFDMTQNKKTGKINVKYKGEDLRLMGKQ